MGTKDTDGWPFPEGTEDYAAIPNDWVFLSARLGCRDCVEDSALLMTLWAHSQGMVFKDGRDGPEWTDPVSIETLSADIGRGRFTPQEIEFAITRLQKLGAIESQRSGPGLFRYRVCYDQWPEIGRRTDPKFDETLQSLQAKGLL
jgi:hypothetical protein